jgi:hypothetical protein
MKGVGSEGGGGGGGEGVVGEVGLERRRGNVE